jgi:bis(5'-nucleosyl)-tetraphosphatase (symmetrical)
MATYAIGDIQGCFGPLQRLLGRIRFDPSRDRLWLAGDLVNRGPRSLDVVRWARSLGERVVTVLGNHEIHLLAIASGVREVREKDTFLDILEAPDADALVEWIADWPLLHIGEDHFLVHGGLLPQWTLPQAATLARGAEAALRRPDRASLLDLVAESSPQWSDQLSSRRQYAVATAVMTRLRVVTETGAVYHDFSGEPNDVPQGCLPWYAAPDRRWPSHRTALFGHWAAHGHRVMDEHRAVALDSGCCWGAQLTAYRLEDGVTFQVSCAPSRR